MLGIYIKPLREAFHHLFLGHSFDDFYISEIRLSQDFSLTAEGKRFGEEGEAYIRWSRLRPLIYPFIKGEKPPRSLSLVFLLSEEKTISFLKRFSLPYEESALPQLFLNLRYKPGALLLTTGISEKSFQLNSDLSRCWDQSVKQFIEGLGLSEDLTISP